MDIDNKLMLVYDHIIELGNNSFAALLGNRYMLIKDSVLYKDEYINLEELIYGLYIFYNNYTNCLILDTESNILIQCTDDNLLFEICNIIDKLDYTTILDRLSFKHKYTLQNKENSIYFKNGIASNTKILKIRIRNRVSSSLFRGNTKEISLLESSKLGNSIRELTEDLRIVSSNNFNIINRQSLYYKDNSIYNLKNCDLVYTCDKYSVISGVNTDDKNILIKVNGSQVEILESGFQYLIKSLNHVVVKYSNSINTLYQLDNLTKLRDDLQFLCELNEYYFYRYNDNKDTVYAAISSATFDMDIYRSKDKKAIYFKAYKSDDRIIKNIYSLVDKDDKCFAIFIHSYLYARHGLYKDITKFWDAIYDTDIENIKVVYSSITNKYYLVNNDYSLADTSSYSNYKDAINNYNTRMTLVDTICIDNGPIKMITYKKEC